MERIQDRLAAAIDRSGISQAELARRLNIAQPTMNTFLNGDATEWKSMIRVARELGVRPEWLQFGEEPISYGEPPDLTKNGVAFRGQHLGISSNIETGFLELGHTEWACIPRYDASLSAGPGAIIDPHASPLGHQLFEAQWLRAITRATPDNLAVVRVDGDSMEPSLRDDDWILVDLTQTRLNREGIYALSVNDTCWVKRITLNLRERLVQVISDNPLYPVQELTEDELTVIGRIVWIVGRKI